MQLQILNARTAIEIDSAFETVAQQHVRGLVVAADTLFGTHRDRLVALAAWRGAGHLQLAEFAALGGLMSYGINLQELYRNVGLIRSKNISPSWSDVKTVLLDFDRAGLQGLVLNLYLPTMTRHQ